MSFQDVAFLIGDGQIEEDSLVRQVGSEEWCEANSVLGLLRAAQKHSGFDERIIEDDEHLQNAIRAESREYRPQIGKGSTHESERQRIVDVAIESFDRVYDQASPIESSRMFSLAVWGPIMLIVCVTAYAFWSEKTYDPFATKDFESVSEPKDDSNSVVATENRLETSD